MSFRPDRPPSFTDLAQRKAKSLLNKLAESNFDSIASQILALVNQSAGESDSKTLLMVVEVCIENAVSQPERSGLYARLCRTLMENTSPEVHADGIADALGKPLGRVLRKILLNKIQQDFESGYQPQTPTAVECTTKRKYLGLVRFLTEIFKVQMLMERIVLECIKKLVVNVEYPPEADMEAAYLLLHNAGSLLETAKARAQMDVYFSRLREITLYEKISNRIRFMLQDLCDQRTRKWAPVERGNLDDIIPTPGDPDPEAERYISDAILSRNLNRIFGANDAERELARLHPDYVPTLVKLLVQYVISAKLEGITSRAVRFLESASSQDLLLTSAVRLGFVMALIRENLPPHFLQFFRKFFCDDQNFRILGNLSQHLLEFDQRYQISNIL
ncbi:armadillo-type protein [Mycena capillaripes]|nr:armadillo-type protein [Mycena capillaripes]